MKLTTKTTLLTVFFAGAMIALLVSASLVAFRHFSVTTAEGHARSAAEIVRVSLTEAMINGVIDHRQQFLKRLAEVKGLHEARVIRSPHVIRQFGEGLSSEHTSDGIEQEVLVSGVPFFDVVQETPPIFRATIPFDATDQGEPNCLQCHQVSTGAVLGAITITISLEQMRRSALVTIAIMTTLVVFFSVLFAFLFRRQIAPVVETAQGVQRVVAQAKEGDFSGRVDREGVDEVGQIARDLNLLMVHLQDNLGRISRDVASLMRYDLPANTNLITYTTEMVEGLVEVAQFKQSIEEDLTKKDVYARISRIIADISGLKTYTLYEVSPSQNHMRVAMVDGVSEGDIRWCDPNILFQADACRVQRTGHIIDSVASPHICSMFLRRTDNLEHICIPVFHSGSVGNVVQLVMPREHGRLAQLLIPFLQVYLRESAPVVEAKRLLNTLKESALRDPMTGLHNRRFLEEYLETLLAATKRKEQRLSVLMMDLDHFKQVNDTHGHEAGDMVLKTLSKVLSTQVRASDMVVRYGGEEFLMVMQESDGFSGERVAEKIRQAVEKMKIPTPSGILRKTISIGVARYPSDGDDFAEVVNFADMALYRAKAEGRNRVVVFQRLMIPGTGEPVA